MAKYTGGWASRDDILRDVALSIAEDIPSEDEIIYAGYHAEPYEGAATIVYRRDGKLWENNDSHCSCMGLEVWKPEETLVEALRKYTGGWGREGLQQALDEAGL